MKGNVLNINSKTISEINLPDGFFSVSEKKHLIYSAIRTQRTNKRRGTASTQQRGDVSYSTKKMRPQKGSGRSRQGARTSNIWKGGAVAFGPHPKTYHIKLNKNEKRVAIFSALSSKFREGNVHIVEEVKITGKTKEIVQLFNGVSDNLKKELGTILLVYSDMNGEVELAANNIPYCKPLNFKFLNVYDIVVYEAILFTKEAVEEMQGWWKNE